ncbi:MAG: TonB-dependent receptor [Candidatus Omnitrophota bacterium]
MRYSFLFRACLLILISLPLTLIYPRICACEDIELDPITVHIDSGADAAHENPASDIGIVNCCWRETRSIDTLLDMEPGVDISRRGVSGIQSDMNIRGCIAGQASVAINGVIVNDPQTGHHNLDLPLPQPAVENIELVKGQSTQAWAQSGMGGSVNIKAKRPRDTESWAFFGYGSDSTENAGVYACFAKDGKGLNAAAEQSSSAGFRQGTDYKQSAVSSSAVFPFGDRISNYILAAYGEKEYGAANFYAPYDSREWTNVFFLNWQSIVEIGNFKIRPSLYHRRYYDKFMLDTKRQDFYINHHATGVSGVMVESEAILKSIGSIVFLIDICGQSIKSTRLGKDSRVRSSYALSWKAHQNPAAGFDLSVRADDYSDFNTHVLPQAGIYVRPYDFVKIRAGVSRSLATPDYTQLNYEDAVSIGNRGLSPESAVNYEAGFDITPGSDNIGLSVTVFNRDVDNMIDWVKHDSADEVFRAENIVEVKTLGFEGLLQVVTAGFLRIKTGYSYTSSDITNPKGYILRYATDRNEHKLSAKIELSLPFGVQRVDIIYKNKKDYNSYLLAGCGINYDLSRDVSLFLTVDNMLNKAYWDIADNPLPGRKYLAGVRARF